MYILTMNSIFLLYVFYYYCMCYIITICVILLPCMCYIITICAILLPYVLYYYHMCFLSFGGLARSYIVNVCAWINTFQAVLN